MKTLLTSLFLVGFFTTTQVHAQQVCNAFFDYTIGNCPNVTFVDNSTAGSPTAQIVSWTYDFGDGNSASTPNTNHTYTSNDNYQVCLTIVSSDSCVTTYCDSIVIDCSWGVAEFDLENTVISPNPVNDVLRLTLKKTLGLNYRIIDLSGVVHKEGALPVVKEYSVDVDALPNGFYLLEVVTDGARIVKRFLKR